MVRSVSLLLLLALPGPAIAWDSARDVVHGTARVLEKGETVIGVFSPLGFGLEDRVTIFMHPALYLFLTPNLWGRFSLTSGDLGTSVEAGYQQSFLGFQEADGSGADIYPGFLQAGLVGSYLINSSWQVTLAAGYVVEFTTGNDSSSQGGVYFRAGGDWLMASNHLMIAEVRGAYMLDSGLSVPTATLLYARQFGRMRVGAGLCAGSFHLATGDLITDSKTGKVVDDTWSFPVYPWVDLWWRF